LDEDEPAAAIRRETEEETGFLITNVERVFKAYMSPGSVNEKLFFFIAFYNENTSRSIGGGVDDEDIEVLELPFETAMKMIADGEVEDGKTIMLLQHLQIKRLISRRA
jgi:GDP-mannose pyrophosphatase NudK